jgi:DNA-binding NarL/FixJ family response regulator
MAIAISLLTRREREVVTLVCQEGLSNKEVAWRLGLTYFSAKTHLASAYQKLSILGGDRELIVRYWKEPRPSLQCVVSGDDEAILG